MNPVEGGVRRRRTRNPVLTGSGDQSVVRYSALSQNVSTRGGIGCAVFRRLYIPGYGDITVFSNASGTAVASYYSTGKFQPGTRIQWEPSVSFTTSGRLFVGFTDNPEVITTINTAYDTFLATSTQGNYDAYAALVKGLGSVVSFPVWQETPITFPTKIRRKRFDINSTINNTVDVFDRCCQTAMFVALEGAPATNAAMGGFHFHDIVDVEGITGTST